jgi:hypothetical protein
VTVLAGRTGTLQGEEARLARALVTWLETGVRPDDLFTEGVFTDMTVPHWRLQAEGLDAAFRLREDGHPFPGTVTVGGLDRTDRGFLVEFEERWEAGGQQWYCREMIHCLVDGDRIGELRVYCCGDWDEALQRRHADDVRLLRP